MTAPTSNSMLVVEDLEVRYGAIVGVSHVTLHVAEGELVALVGANGSGKTTTLSAIAGVRSPARGTIHFLGEPIHRLVSEKIARRGMSLVPEDRGVFPTLTVAQNLRLAASRRRDAQAVGVQEEELFGLFPVLRDRSSQPAGTLSGGEQQQLVIARALLTNPKLLMLDEPSLGLSPRLVDEMFALIQRLHQQGLTILLVEQNVTRTLDICDRAYVLSTGRMVASGTPAEIRQNIDITAAYMGDSAKPQAPHRGADHG